ncbi:class I adenylate-forming enzyme family protein [Desulfovermiculus halophilus]|jgi:long-chain acyl-CoA synthetase|uniref:class I adenylate-forming enzyme family protein n=1 Tax=Desulfovermiculus halophilus TaxID=339722 RepID=UPI00048160F7|nr:class I adenylate-forming enzyme family protein [Desulfovermiculus halophilus]
MNTLRSLWENTTTSWPQKTGLVAGSRRIDYSRAGRMVQALASRLKAEWGLGQQEIVGLLIPNSIEFVLSYFAVVNAGGIVHPLDERLTPDELATVLNDSNPGHIIVHHMLWPKLQLALRAIHSDANILGIGIDDSGVESFEEWLEKDWGASEDAPLFPEHVAELMYTSGTTGKPKGVMRTHANVRAVSRLAIQGFGYTHRDRIVIVMPLSHSSALASQMMPLVELGGSIVLLDTFEPQSLIACIHNEGVTCLRAVPTIFRSMLLFERFCSAHLPSLRLLMNSSAPIDPETYLAIKERFPGIEIVNSYGLTEASTCTVLPDSMARVRPDSIGAPITGVEMSVRNEQGKAVSPGVEGEIWIRGVHVFGGYYNQPEATQKALTEDRWLRTGDLGSCDNEGYYYFHGRKDHMINCGGRKFAPLEVENCILELDHVADVAVAGIEHKALGQVAQAFVVFKNGASPDGKEVVRHCARRLPSHKVPFYVQAVRSLPKNGLGKVLYRNLHCQQSDGAEQ